MSGRHLRKLQKPHGGYVTYSIWSSLRANYSTLRKEAGNEANVGSLLVYVLGIHGAAPALTLVRSRECSFESAIVLYCYLLSESDATLL
ncbi:hypothetical protein Dsin_011766 [Dipteronia sinensis]|uniref:Uncharacterized protein n=1 Tax=Dipteronia sinensis TaxID=43782 RepID=A0AAE0AGT8_9ROSI|nr:hypothetical protein Dsin_011766 [Dipteronia sinensis]